MRRTCSYAVAIAALSAVPAQAQFMMPRLHISAGVSADVPIGNLDTFANTGFGVAVRTESPLGGPEWGLRGGVSFDRMGGKDNTNVNYFEYLTFATELVHNTNPRTYQYAGVGIYQQKIVFEPVTTGFGFTTSAESESDFGFQGGVGLNFGTTVKTFLEIGVVDVLTTGKSSVWFPLRFGFRI